MLINIDYNKGIPFFEKAVLQTAILQNKDILTQKEKSQLLVLKYIILKMKLEIQIEYLFKELISLGDDESD
jgi:hypothetical protein